MADQLLQFLPRLSLRDRDHQFVLPRRQLQDPLSLRELHELQRGRRPMRTPPVLRREELEKKPGVAETLDWARALTGIGVGSLDRDPAALNASLICLLKTESDLKSVTPEVTARLVGKVA